MTSETIELVERVRQRLDHQENPVRIAGPVSESAISAAEEALGCTFPPSYRQFLRTWGGIALPTHLGIVHDFIGVVVRRRAMATSSPARCAPARSASSPSTSSSSGWARSTRSGSASTRRGPCPTASTRSLLFDARDNALDQQFYDDFGQMLEEVMGFVADSLDQPLD